MTASVLSVSSTGPTSRYDLPAPTLPPRIAGLAKVAGNLAWAWNREARDLFAAIDDRLWTRVRGNPIALLRLVDAERLVACAADPGFVAAYDGVMRWFEADGSWEETWYARQYPALVGRPAAYFCAEFGVHSSVPIYSGGLGVLAGDHCKAASDLGVPLVGVGILYRAGYVDQHIRPDGWQEDSQDWVDIGLTPLTPLTGPGDAPYLATVRMAGRDVAVRGMQLQVGRTRIVLLDSDVDPNHPDDRALLSQLYGGGLEVRLRQEWLLGVAGVRALRALNIDPAVWHSNEGHAAFMLIERLRELTTQGVPFADAIHAVRQKSVFTTHTPVPAGHDVFPRDAVAHIAGPIWEELGVDADTLFHLGYDPAHGHGSFHMTATAIRLSRRVNGVSRRHGAVTRTLWAPLWPGRTPDEVPIGSITNGVHLATWMANSVMTLLDRHLGPDWGAHADDPEIWERVLSLDPEDLWRVHVAEKQRLMQFVRDEARQSYATRALEATQLVGAGTLLDPNALTIGFARRFATYKRADMIFQDVERLRLLLINRERPVQIIFAGKAHPADTPGKHLLQAVYHFTREPRFEGRVAFLEDYDMRVAQLLVRGVDLWLNLPRVSMEASGTSGMKAALNGVPQIGTIDGWWEEGFDGANGWTLGPVPDDADDATAEALYATLENQVVPRFYARNGRDVPEQWVATMCAALRAAGRHYSARRMMQEYVTTSYVPSIVGPAKGDDPPTA
jgi:glycogen phosphorylase